MEGQGINTMLIHNIALYSFEIELSLFIPFIKQNF